MACELVAACFQLHDVGDLFHERLGALARTLMKSSCALFGQVEVTLNRSSCQNRLDDMGAGWENIQT